jgi:MYXO-CTERM domain-containing protein
MEFQMRNKTFISSMVGVAAAAAVAGSANAAIVTGPGIGSDCATFSGSSPTTITYSAFSDAGWDGTLDSFKIKTVLFSGSTATPISIGLIEYSYNAGTNWNVYSLTSTSADNTSILSGSTGWGALITPSSVTVGNNNFRVRVTIPANVAIVNAMNFRMSLNWSNTSFEGGTNSRNSVAVPAPGAFALLGVAGLVGARRRRA